jgi:NAD(P)-dependent dehydrogenase (short-subunit alcohol dehydrogenase family)
MAVLQGKVAVVTGGTSGIGARTVELFVEEGAKVVIAGRRRDEGKALAKSLGLNASYFCVDVRREADVQAMITHAVTKYGRLDCLFNNAGNPGRVTSIADVDVTHLNDILAVHVCGVMLGMKHAAPIMIRQGSGSIINTGSIAGLRTGFSAHGYSAAKAAVIHMSRCVAVELGEKGIRVNSISPGSIVTGIFGKAAGLPDQIADATASRLTARFATFQSTPRAGVPNDIAHTALFLASDASSFINGQDLLVDGGNVGGLPWSEMLAQRRAFAAELSKHGEVEG